MDLVHFNKLFSDAAFRYPVNYQSLLAFLNKAKNPENHSILVWKLVDLCRRVYKTFGLLEWKKDCIELIDAGFIWKSDKYVYAACSLPFFPPQFFSDGKSFPLDLSGESWTDSCDMEEILIPDILILIFGFVPRKDLLFSVRFVNRRWRRCCQADNLWIPVIERMREANLLQEEWIRPLAINTVIRHSLYSWPNKEYWLYPVDWLDENFSGPYIELMWPHIAAKLGLDEEYVIEDDTDLMRQKRPKKERGQEVWCLYGTAGGNELNIIRVKEPLRSDGPGVATYETPQKRKTVQNFLKTFWEPALFLLLSGPF